MSPVFQQRMWLRFLKQNPDFKSYCLAKRSGDAAACVTLEEKFRLIGELYNDLGDVYAVDAGNARSQSFKRWSSEKWPLFFTPVHVHAVHEAAGYQYRAGHLLLEVTLVEDKAKALAAVDSYLTHVYAGRARAAEKSPLPNMRLAMQELPRPKYALLGKVNKATDGVIRKAIYAGMHRRVTKDAKPLSIADTVLAMKQDPKNPFGWAMTADDKRDLATGIFKKSVRLSSEVTLLKRARSDFDAMVRNTIHGRFPDPS